MLNYPRMQSLCRVSVFALALSAIVSIASPAVADNSNLKILTDIAPVHSLVTMVVGEHADVELLVPPSQSPHSYQLKPSQVNAINKSSLVVILNDDFIPALSRHLNSINAQATLLELASATLMHEHNAESHKEATAKEDNADQANPSNAELSDSLSQGPHTWLDPNNAIEWIDAIATTISEKDAVNAAAYQRNAKQAKNQLRELQQAVQQQLAGLDSVSYIVYHDAYRHFAHSYGLRDPIAIALSDARAPGAAQLSLIRAKITQSTCVFSEVLHNDAIVDMVSEGTSVNRAILDPMGSNQLVGPTL